MKKIQIAIVSTIATALMIRCSSDDEVLIAPPSEGATLDISVGGPTQPNQVYVDLSSNMETIVKRDTWDIGFYSGNDFRVVLNLSVGMLAFALDTSADRCGKILW